MCKNQNSTHITRYYEVNHINGLIPLHVTVRYTLTANRVTDLNGLMWQIIYKALKLKGFVYKIYFQV